MSGLAALALMASPAYASISTSGCDTVDPLTCTLNEMFAGGSITINDKIFNTWTLFEGTDIGSAGFAGIVVQPIDDPLNPGFTFARSSEGTEPTVGATESLSFEFGFKVATTDGSFRIKDTSLSIAGANAFSFEEGGSVEITQYACTTGFEFFGECGTLLNAPAGDFVSGGPSSLDILSDGHTFAPQNQAFVSAFFNLTASEGAGELNSWEQRVSQVEPAGPSVPEPGSLALMGAGLVAALGAWRRRGRT